MFQTHTYIYSYIRQFFTETIREDPTFIILLKDDELVVIS